MEGIINNFPGYEYVRGEDGKMHNMYRGTDVGFGGYVYAEPGIYTNVALIDVASMHPTSIIRLNKLGEYTQRYADLRQARVYIKHKDYKSAGELFDGKLKKYLTSDAEAKALSTALKLPLNSFYGISDAGYSNPARDSRDKNNIIALRGALFMRTLQDEVQERGFTVAHIKTDSIKIPNATPEIIEFVMDFGRKYGYEFEHEATYERMCLVNDAVYIAKYADGEHEYELPTGQKIKTAWTATGAQFAVPYVFKSLFSGSDYIFKDFCETKSVSAGEMWIDMNEDLPEGEHNYIFVGRVGQYCPIREGCGGGEVFRKKDDKYYAVTGTKGFRWLESETVKAEGKEACIDMAYFTKLADAAVAKINEQGEKIGVTYEDFAMGDIDILMGRKPLPDFMNVPEPEVDPIPF